MNSPTPTLVELRSSQPGLKATLVTPEARFPMLIGCDARAFGRLRKLRVAVVGVGSVGMRAALHLARLGAGSLILVDPKCFKSESLLTHEVRLADIGQPKALVVARLCKEISSSTRVFAFVGPVEALEADALAGVDLVIMAPDLLSVEIELAQRCLHLGLPLVQASVHGESFVAQVRFYANATAQGCCAGCFLGREEWKQLSRQARFSCEGATGGSNPPRTDAPITASFSSLCSLAADLAINQVLRFTLQAGEPVTDTLLEYCGFNHRTVVSKIARNPRCPLDHFTYRRVALAKPPGRLSLAALAQAATGEAAGENTLFELAGMAWVEFGRCRCAQMRPVWRFVSRGQDNAFHCPKCDAPVVPLQFYTHQRISAALLGAALEKPLSKLGASRVRSVWVRNADSGALVTQSPAQSAKP